jgi:hypothetical protein
LYRIAPCAELYDPTDLRHGWSELGAGAGMLMIGWISTALVIWSGAEAPNKNNILNFLGGVVAGSVRFVGRVQMN